MINTKLSMFLGTVLIYVHQKAALYKVPNFVKTINSNSVGNDKEMTMAEETKDNSSFAIQLSLVSLLSHTSTLQNRFRGLHVHGRHRCGKCGLGGPQIYTFAVLFMGQTVSKTKPLRVSWHDDFFFHIKYLLTYVRDLVRVVQAR